MGEYTCTFVSPLRGLICLRVDWNLGAYLSLKSRRISVTFGVYVVPPSFNGVGSAF